MTQIELNNYCMGKRIPVCFALCNNRSDCFNEEFDFLIYKEIYFTETKLGIVHIILN